jgi:hypothetical protein
MPLMSAVELRRRTHITLSSRGDHMEDIIAALALYHHGPTLQNLEALWKAFSVWKAIHNNWKQDRRNLVAGMNRPLEELDTALRQIFVDLARASLASAARTIGRAFGDQMDPVYRQAMIDTFINPPAIPASDPKCFVWFRNSNAWSVRLQSVGWQDTQGATTGFTMVEEADDVRQYNNHYAAPAQVEKLVLVGSYISGGVTPPGNRMIQVSTLDHHTLVHEMLHWTTHASFEKYAKAQYGKGNQGKLIREGITEWLTRTALGDMDNGTYRDLIPIVKGIAQRWNLSQVHAAYFRGEKNSAFCDGYVAAVEKNPLYQGIVDRA